MISRTRRCVITMLLAVALMLLLSSERAQAQCRSGQHQQRISQPQTAVLTVMQPQQFALLTALRQQQQYAMLIALRQQQTAMLTALQQQQATTLLTAMQQNNALLTALQQQQLNALLTALQQQYAITTQRALLAPGDQ